MVQASTKIIKKKYLFSVITPTYKRLGNLKKLYKNLLSQKNKNLCEWVLVLEKKDLPTLKFEKEIKKKKKN